MKEIATYRASIFRYATASLIPRINLACYVVVTLRIEKDLRMIPSNHYVSYLFILAIIILALTLCQLKKDVNIALLMYLKKKKKSYLCIVKYVRLDAC